jgi:hypothetical protein
MLLPAGVMDKLELSVWFWCIAGFLPFIFMAV